MAKKGKQPPSREVTKRRLARWEQERRRRRITVIIGSSIVAVVIAVVACGYYFTQVAPAREWLSKVGPAGDRTVIYAGDYVETLRLYQLGLYQSSTDQRQEPLVLLENRALVLKAAQAYPIDPVTDDAIDEEVRAMLVAEDEDVDDEELEERYQAVLTTFALTDGQFRDIVRVGILEQRLDEYLKGQLPQVGAEVRHAHVEAIVVADEETAQEVEERLEEEEFTALADEYGLGDIGWLPEGLMGPGFDDVAFTIELDTASEPVVAQGGYYIVRVLEREDRALEQSMRQTMEANVFSFWLEEEREEKVERNPGLDLDQTFLWALDQIS